MCLYFAGVLVLASNNKVYMKLKTLIKELEIYRKKFKAKTGKEPIIWNVHSGIDDLEVSLCEGKDVSGPLISSKGEILDFKVKEVY